MEASFCFIAAKNNLDKARRYIKIGEGTQWVAEHISSGLIWAMEGWVIARDYKISQGHGWRDTLSDFYKYAPEDLCSMARHCNSEATVLDNEFQGAYNYEEGLPPMPMDEWKARICVCLEETEDVVNQLINDAQAPAP